jgi:hypothetical protein
MESKPRLELATLPTRHPNVGRTFLRQCGTAAVLRLSIDPFRMPAGAKGREITIDWISRERPQSRTEEMREIGWGDLEGASYEDCIQLSMAFPKERITEDAATAVMALLINELEGVIIEEVLPQGSGADYRVTLKSTGSDLPVEVSGIQEDRTGGESSSRLAKKYNQLLKDNAAGFVSVTTFRRLQAGILHSYLHYVVKPAAGKKHKGRGKRRK